MNAKTSALAPGSRSLARAVASGLMLGVMLCISTPAQAAFHLWTIREVYTDSSGSLQFIELFTSSSGQDFVGGQSVRVSNGTTTNTFTIPSNTPSGGTASKALLIATAGAQAAGAPAPNYVMPDNFLLAGGGTISFFGAN